MSITVPVSNNQGILVTSSQGISSYPNQWDPYNHGAGISISSLQENVRGEMVLIEKVFDPSAEKVPDREEMKHMLILELVEKLLKSNYVEFTKQDDLKTNLVTYRARAYLTPDDQVRTLRREIL